MILQMPNERVLLHICCAPCATTVVRRLQAAGYDVHGYFYNPNIQPEKEYYQRLLEAQRLCKEWGIPLEIGEYDRDRWQAEVRGLEAEKEGGKRCIVCYRYRLAALAQKAIELEIGVIATTLTISPHKRADVINPIGRGITEAIAAERDDDLRITFLEADWKKKDGYKQSLATCRELHIYRQDYCGCKYSLSEREERIRARAALEAARPAQEKKIETGQKPVKRTTRAMKILTEPAPAKTEPVPDSRAKWELSPLERKKKRDKKAKPWQKK